LYVQQITARILALIFLLGRGYGMSEIREQLRELKSLLKKKPGKKKETIVKENKANSIQGQEAKRKETKIDFLSEKTPQTKEKSGLKENILNFYYSLEDKYYDLMDKINSKIPVYKVIDPIDELIPSFLLFAGIILVLLLLVLYFAFFSVASTESAVFTVTLTKEDSSEILAGYKVFLFVDGNKNSLVTDENAQVSIGVPLNTKVKIEVKDVPGYMDYNKLVYVTKKEQFFTVKLKKKQEIVLSSGWRKRTIYFKDESGRLVNELLRVSFACSEGSDFLEIVGETSLRTSITSGSLQLKVNEDECTEIFFSVESSDYESITNELLSSNTIYLERKKEPKGTIHIKVFDELGNLIEDTLKFSLFEESDFNSVNGFDSVSIYSGTKDFEVNPGNYYIKVFDARSEPKYSCNNSSDAKELLAGEEITFEVDCFVVSSDDLILISVVDKASGEAVNSRIELFKKEENQFKFFEVKKNVSSASFAVDDNKSGFIALISSKNYLLHLTKLLHAGDSVKVELEKLTEMNSGKALIKVSNFKGNTASSGKVYLRFASGPLKDYRIYSKPIGFKGKALIEGVKPGQYYAEAQTKTERGFSVSKSIDANKLTEFEVRMKRERGWVELNVFKENSSKLSGFNVVFFDALTGKEIPSTEFVFDSKKNLYFFTEGSYFAVVSKEGYVPTRSKKFRVVINSKTVVNVVLKKKKASEAVSIDFVGFFKENGLPLTSLSLNQEYSADFLVAVNPDINVFYFDFLIGTGRENSMNRDSIYITSFENPFPEEMQVKKSTSFTGDYSVDFESNLTEGNSKVVLASFDDFDYRESSDTAFTVSVKFKLKQRILDANNLVLFFRALAVRDRENPEYFLDPEDDREFTSLEEYAYSKHKIKDIELCEEDFCYSFSVSSNSSDSSCGVLNFGSVSSVKINCPYRFSSSVLNNSRNYSLVNFSVSNTALGTSEQLNAIVFNRYVIEKKSEKFEGNANDSIIEETFSSFSEKEFVFADTNFTPVKLVKKIGKRIPAIKTKFSGIDENFQELRIRTDLNLNLNVKPEEITPFTETQLEVEVLDSEGNPVQALIKVEVQGTLIDSVDTDEFGEATFELPALYPLSKVKVTAEAETTTSKVLYVGNAETFSFEPESLQFLFSSSDSETHSMDITFFDLSNGELRQRIIEYTIDFNSHAEYFDKNKLRNYGNEFTSDGIPVKFELALNTDETFDLNYNVSIAGNLNLIIKINDYSFEKTIPVLVLINAASGYESDYLAAFFPPGGEEVSSENKVFVSLFSDQSSTKTEFSLKKKNVPKELKIIEVELNSDSTYLNLNEMQLQLKDQLEDTTVSDEVIVDFNVVLNPSASGILDKETETGEIKLLFEVDGIPAFLLLPFEVEIVSVNAALDVSPEKLEYVFNVGGSTSQTKTLNFKSSSSFLDLTLNDISFDLDNEFVLFAYPFYSSSVSHEGQDIDFTLTLTQKGEALQTSKAINGTIIVEYSVRDRNAVKEIPVKVSILTSVQEITSQYFDLQACIGEGALNEKKGNFDVSFWIGCNIGESLPSLDCSPEKPRILLDWTFDSFNVDSFNGIGKCTKPNESYLNYIYCDATQFSMELIDRIVKFKQGDPNKEGDFNFKATLISDKFSNEFFEDFDEWAVNSFFEAPTDYTNESDYDLVRKYFAEQKISVEVNSYVSDTKPREISVPGWYNVDVNVSRERLYITFTLLKTSAELEGRNYDSVFYYIPFDGKVGLKDNEFNRVNYGSSFDVYSPSSKFKLQDEIDSPLEIHSSPTLSGYRILWIREFNDFNNLASNLYKGTIMELARDVTGKLRTIKFYPSYATPLIMEADLNELSDAFIYYEVVDPENNRQLTSSKNLIEWNGLGNCVDFTGNSMQSSFLDRKAEPSDKANLGLSDLNSVFKLSWFNPSRKGKIFLASVVYSPANAPLHYLKILSYSPGKNPFKKVTLYSMNETSELFEDNWIPLRGTGFQLNNSPTSSVDSLKDLFDLIEAGYACIKNEGNFTYILWNNQSLLDEISGVEYNLNVDSECIKQ
jgi:hypothetical protein